ncbi:MAG: hypothetical protein RR051_04835, partial [Clostridiales bacterium]
QAYVALNMRLGRVAVNEVVLGKQVLLPRIETSYKEWDFREKAAAAGDDLLALDQYIRQRGGSFLYVGAPDQYSLFRDWYPVYQYNNSTWLEQAESCFFAALDKRQIAYINMRPIFMAEKAYDRFYYKSDHHYNLLGAYRTYEQIAKKLAEDGWNCAMLDQRELIFEQLPNPFCGSRGRKLYGLSPVADQAVIYSLVKPIPFRRFDDGVAVDATVFALPQSSQDQVSYSLYMGGDIGETVIETNRPALPDVLLFGDSFTNALETLLYTGFDQTRSVDLRYYQDRDIYAYIQRYDPDIVICLRNDNDYMVREGNGAILP